MRRVFVLALTALLLLATSVSASAGETKRATEPPGGMPPADQLESVLTEWLEAGDDLHAAWAGWITADRQLRALAGAVAERLARSTVEEPRGKNTYFVEAALLDALVQTGATAPGKTLIRAASSSIEAVTVLLCRRHAYDPAHLEMFNRVGKGTGYEEYVALGNVMAAWRAPEFTARILSNLELRRRVHIWDEDPPYPLFREPGDSVPGDWRGRVPVGFPPVASYVLSFERYTEKEWSLLADGIHPVYARRYVNRGDIIGGGASGCWPEPRDEYRHEWLTASLEGTDVPALPLYETVDIKWTGGRQPWSRRTRMAVENLYDDFRAWRDALHARGLLTDRARRTVRPKIELKVVDRRRYPRDPLPPFPEVPFDPKVPERRRPSVRGDV